MLTFRDIATALVCGFLAASVAYAAEGALGTNAGGSKAGAAHAAVHATQPPAIVKPVGCQPTASGAAVTS